jgi:hypothetical protein
MKFFKYTLLWALVGWCCLCQPLLLAQNNNTLSPYSNVGLGEKEGGYFAKQRAMSGVGMASFSSNDYTFINPASLGFINKTVFDFGFRGDIGYHQLGSQYRDYMNGNFNYLSLGFSMVNKVKVFTADTTFVDGKVAQITGTNKISQRFNWSAGFTFSPYSSMGASFQQKTDTLGVSPLSQLITSGGISNLSFQQAFRFGRHISLGHSFQVLWGQSTHIADISFPDSQLMLGLQRLDVSNYQGFSHKFGLGISIPFASYAHLDLGAAFDPAFSINRKRDNISRIVDRRGPRPDADTLSFASDNEVLQVPLHFSAGAMLTINHYISMGLDYTRQNWSEQNQSEWKQTFTNYEKWAFAITLNPHNGASSPPSKPEVYLGLSQTHLHHSFINNQNILTPVLESGMSFGLGIPVMKDVFNSEGKRERVRSMIYFSSEYIQRGKNNNANLIHDHLFRFNLALSLTDIWFNKRRYR